MRRELRARVRLFPSSHSPRSRERREPRVGWGGFFLPLTLPVPERGENPAWGGGALSFLSLSPYPGSLSVCSALSVFFSVSFCVGALGMRTIISAHIFQLCPTSSPSPTPQPSRRSAFSGEARTPRGGGALSSLSFSPYPGSLSVCSALSVFFSVSFCVGAVPGTVDVVRLMSSLSISYARS